MIFNSLVFLIFFVVVFILYRLPLGWATKKAFLLVSNYVFFASYHPIYVWLLLFSTVVDYFAGWGMHKADNRRGRTVLLVVSLVANLGLLGFFKYAQFALDNVGWLASLAGTGWTPPDIDILLPVGISFYTFQTLSYTIDVYRGHIEPTKSFVDFAFFVSFFPQLVAGPIVRAEEFLPQCIEPRHTDSHHIGWGLSLFTIGLFEKIVLADRVLGPVADKVYMSPHAATFIDAWMGAVAFSGQIFFDFGGYSLCAIGTAMCFGFVLPDNFRCPYAAVGFSDFWSRWHISLSTWLRDYCPVSFE